MKLVEVNVPLFKREVLKKIRTLFKGTHILSKHRIRRIEHLILMMNVELQKAEDEAKKAKEKAKLLRAQEPAVKSANRKATTRIAS